MRPLIALLPLLVACQSEYEILPGHSYVAPTPMGDAPAIRVSPESIDFGAVHFDGQTIASAEILVENVGDDLLVLEEVTWGDGDQVFVWDQSDNTLLQPGASLTIPVGFLPDAVSPAEGWLNFHSTDPDRPTVQVALTGHGVGPQIALTPDHDDYGLVPVGCIEERSLIISNVGNEDLTVEDLWLAIDEGVFELLDPTETLGALPWVLEPGASVEVGHLFEPDDIFDHLGSLIVRSDDPLRPEAEAVIVGEGSPSNGVIDSFLQPMGGGDPDILFVLDNSCSMEDNQRALASNVESFFTVFEEAGISDYQIGVITTDRSTLQGAIITEEMADPASELASQARVGVSGNGFERGIDMASDAIAAGADGLIREDGSLSVIFVSDEPDQSATTAKTLIAQLYALKADQDKVVAHAVAGDVPGGCATAEPGTGYDEVVTGTGGMFLSICSTDWGAALEIIAEGAGGVIDTFSLSEDPYEPSIEVRVDGRPVLDGWTYDAEDNAIHFDDDAIPEGGSEIDVDYTLGSSCER